MTKETLYEVLGDIHEKHIQEAHRSQGMVRKSGWIKWRITAACLCLVAVAAITAATSLLKQSENHGVGSHESSPAPNVIAAPGFFTLTAYAASPDEDGAAELPVDEEVIMQEGIEIPVHYNWSLAMSSRPGIPLKLSAVEHPDTTFEVSADGGELLLWNEDEITHVTSPFYAENGTTIYWASLSPTVDPQTGEREFEPYTENKAYIHIVLQEGENIVGYAVVEIYTDDLGRDAGQIKMYYAKLLKSVSFPKVNGSYQEITNQYVESEIKQIKNKSSDIER